MATPHEDSLFFRSLEPPEGWEGGPGAMAASQRARMLDAVVRVVADRGYVNVTVADIVGHAGVSRRTFYEHFSDRQACFLAAYETGVAMLVGDIAGRTAAAPEGDWRRQLRLGLESYTCALAAEPLFARVLIVDVLAAGPAAIELRQRLAGVFIERFRAASALAVAEDPRIVPVPDVFLRALVGGIAELVQHHILEHGAETLEELAPVLVELACTVIEYGGVRAGPAVLEGH